MKGSRSLTETSHFAKQDGRSSWDDNPRQRVAKAQSGVDQPRRRGISGSTLALRNPGTTPITPSSRAVPRAEVGITETYPPVMDRWRLVGAATRDTKRCPLPSPRNDPLIQEGARARDVTPRRVGGSPGVRITAIMVQRRFSLSLSLSERGRLRRRPVWRRSDERLLQAEKAVLVRRARGRISRAFTDFTAELRRLGCGDYSATRSGPKAADRGSPGSGVAGDIPIPAREPTGRYESAIVVDVGTWVAKYELAKRIIMREAAQRSRREGRSRAKCSEPHSMECSAPGLGNVADASLHSWASGFAATTGPNYSLPTKENRARFSAVLLPDFHTRESCWAMPLADGFSQGSPASGAAPFSPRFTLISSRELVAVLLPRTATQLREPDHDATCPEVLRSVAEEWARFCDANEMKEPLWNVLPRRVQDFFTWGGRLWCSYELADQKALLDCFRELIL
ncbi:hypothetical protein PR048_032213 [Dryococelus australis]|uniref:Uncharacterized protein n=1 Tax=Dryococelus australis TaxID=614101 RepID=A0ABQ9G1K8_9NEOP|nr:hypothetical protein PR048_032213 [Dryococelus australis]